MNASTLAIWRAAVDSVSVLDERHDDQSYSEMVAEKFLRDVLIDIATHTTNPGDVGAVADILLQYVGIDSEK